ncbi:MAG: type II toxin-antitoxin system VapC family toxin [Mariprofundaceae bacterium]|nr:type II toxin-antitoxin system VapC family toxin [Mariprofundaceae bacterium]
MILYCDTSALIKLYIAEEHSELLKIQVEKADAVAVCRIAWAEAHAALSRRAREVREDSPLIEQAKAALTHDWPNYVILEVNQSLVELAGDYADTFALRGYDSIQLAAAAETGRISHSPLTFACFDMRLNKAARVLGLQTLPI